MRLNNIFTSGAVFPKGKTIRIFGTGKGECEIEFAGIKKSLKSEDDVWCAEFPPMQYGGPYTLIFTSDGERVELNDIYIGEVYLFGGQSNIAFMLKASNTPVEDYEEIEGLRLFKCQNDPSLDECWQSARLGVIEEFSALGYHVGTYNSEGDPLPSFEGEPKTLVLPEMSIDELTAHIWENLNQDNKVSLFVRYIDIKSGESDTRIVNKNA